MTVDDRALNRRVWASLARELPPTSADTPLRVLEIGAGIATMVERVLGWDLLAHSEYKAVDVDRANIEEAGRRLRSLAGGSGYTLADSGPEWLTLSREDRMARVELEAADAFDFVGRKNEARSWDLLIASAFLDLVDVPAILPGLLSLLRPGGLFYFTVNFDGSTVLEPQIDRDLDALIEELYHRTMDSGLEGRTGGSRTGRRLFAYLAAAGAQILDAGASDWVVHPGPRGYEADEAYFLHHIVHTISEALRGSPELDTEAFAEWVDLRHDQIERAELVYIAHQLDFLGRVSPSSQPLGES